MNNFNGFLYGESYPIIKWEDKEDINFWIKPKNNWAKCPKCGCKYDKFHEAHSRKIQDTTIHNKNF